MKKYQKAWIAQLKDAWNNPDKNCILWKVTTEIIEDDTGDTDELTQELAKWLAEASN